MLFRVDILEFFVPFRLDRKPRVTADFDQDWEVFTGYMLIACFLVANTPLDPSHIVNHRTVVAVLTGEFKGFHPSSTQKI